MFKEKLLATLTVLALLLPQTGLASNIFGFGGASDSVKGQYEFTYDGKTTLESTLLLRNGEREKETVVRLSAVDAQTNNQGDLFYKENGQPQSKIGTWVKFDQTEVRLPPKGEARVHFVITLPDKITPGIYAGGLTAEDITDVQTTSEAGKTDSSSGFSVIMKARLLKPILINVPGEKVSKFQSGELTFNQKSNPKTLLFDIQNQGNTLLAAKGTLEIKNGETTVKVFPIDAKGILAEDTFHGQYEWREAPAWGNFTAQLSLDVSAYDPFTETYTQLGNVKKDVSISLTSYNSLLPYLYGLLALILLIVVIVVKNYLYKAKCVPYTILANDTLNSVAEKFGMGWKKLASINKIKAPYQLKTGTKILVRAKDDAKKK